MNLYCLTHAGTNARILVVALMLAVSAPVMASIKNADSLNKRHTFYNNKSKLLTIQQRLQVFYPVENNAAYSITVCADLPVNTDPTRVFKKGEPGHVFLILYKHNLLTGEIVSRSFGFYPRLPVSCLFKKTKSKILDNNDREYNASIEKKLTAAEFELVLQQCINASRKKYNLKKYNCYDYVLEVFNSLPGIEKLPVTYVKFPLIFGRGGSPCGLYSDLQTLASSGSAWAPYIKFGLFKSPAVEIKQDVIASFQIINN